MLGEFLLRTQMRVFVAGDFNGGRRRRADHVGVPIRVQARGPVDVLDPKAKLAFDRGVGFFLFFCVFEQQLLERRRDEALRLVFRDV